MEEQLEAVMKKMKKLEKHMNEIKAEEKSLLAEYKRLTNQYYMLMLESIASKTEAKSDENSSEKLIQKRKK